MTDEELTRARCAEAKRVADGLHSRTSHLWVAAFIGGLIELCRTGWTPPEPVDPDVLEVRKIVASLWRQIDPTFSEQVGLGNKDSTTIFTTALAAIRRGREIERAATNADVRCAEVRHEGAEGDSHD